MAPIATSKLPEKLAPSRQDIYQGKDLDSLVFRINMMMLDFPTQYRSRITVLSVVLPSL